MKTLETLAAIVTALLAFVGLWTVAMAVRVEIAHRKRKNKGAKL